MKILIKGSHTNHDDDLCEEDENIPSTEEKTDNDQSDNEICTSNYYRNSYECSEAE